MYGTTFHGSISIACAGKEEPYIIPTPYGEMRSRSGAQLKYTANDALKFHQSILKNNPLGESANIFLENPTKDEVKESIEQIREVLAEKSGNGFYFFFAGHGIYGTGDLVLADENLTAVELLEMIGGTNDDHDISLTTEIRLDSCYSGSFLIDIILELEKEIYNVYLMEGFAASMFDEKSWEMSFLEHGAYSFTLLHPGNEYVNSKQLVEAIENNNHRIIAKYAQAGIAMKAPPIPFLTQARQHSMSVYKHNLIGMDNYGDFQLSDLKPPLTREKIIAEIIEIRSSFLKSIGKNV